MTPHKTKNVFIAKKDIGKTKVKNKKQNKTKQKKTPSE